jgi:hypothetical protein
MNTSIAQKAAELLEMAIDADDELVEFACRRIIHADAFGGRVKIADVETVIEFHDMIAA